MSSLKKNSVYIGSKIPQNQKIILESAIDNGDYLNISGFVRDAVKKPTREGLIIRKIYRRELMKMVSTRNRTCGSNGCNKDVKRKADL